METLPGKGGGEMDGDSTREWGGEMDGDSTYQEWGWGNGYQEWEWGNGWRLYQEKGVGKWKSAS